MIGLKVRKVLTIYGSFFNDPVEQFVLSTFRKPSVLLHILSLLGVDLQVL
jgi:hypothetical protein